MEFEPWSRDDSAMVPPSHQISVSWVNYLEFVFGSGRVTRGILALNGLHVHLAVYVCVA